MLNRLKIMLRYLKHSFVIRNNKIGKRILIFLAICFVTLIAVNLFAIFVPVKTQEIIVRIKHGDNTGIIASKLKRNGVIRSAFWFNVIARVTKSDRQLKSGRYVFGGTDNLMQTIKKIKEGRSTLIHLTIPEGYSLYQTLKKMESIGLGNFDSLMTMTYDPKLVNKLTGFDVLSLEGFLYPETYVFDIDINTEDIFSLMTGHFFKKLALSEISIQDKAKFYKDLILASIVEREAVKDGEKPLIAGVYLNRIKKGMKLESCPTVDYILEQQGTKRRQLTYDDLQLPSPYNTYVHTGLPPTPICNPTIFSLAATQNPEVTNYLYFFADFEGNNVFSKTYTEHLNKQKIYNKRATNN